MADNVAITAGSGTNISTDDCGAGGHAQIVKLAISTDGSATLIPAEATNGLDVDVTRVQGSVTVANGGTFAVQSTHAAGATTIAKAEDSASGDLDVGAPAMAVRKATPANTSGTDGDYEFLQMSAGRLWVDGSGVTLTADTELPAAAALADNTANPTVPAVGSFLMGYDGTNWDRVRADGGSVYIQDGGNSITTDSAFATVSTDVTRPADTVAYAVNDALSDSTSAPTSGGFTFTSAARASGGSGIITDAMICTSADAATLLQGEIFLFNTSVTNVNDNTAFAISDAEAKTCIGKIPFTLEDIGNNGWYHAQNLNIGFTCSGSANLRFLVRVKNAYTPVSAEVLTFMLKILQVT